MPLYAWVKFREILHGGWSRTNHVLRFFREEGDGPGAISLDILLDETHRACRSRGNMVIVVGISKLRGKPEVRRLPL